MGIGPRQAPLGLLPVAPPRYSLITAPGVLVTGSNRWELGVDVEPEGCTVPLDLTGAATTDVPYWWDADTDGTIPATTYATRMGGTKDIGLPQPRLRFDAITLWAGYQTTATELGSAERRDDINNRVTRRLAALTPPAIERELWTGNVALAAGYDNPYLRKSTATNLGWFGFVSALGALEQAIAEKFLVGQSMIHAQPRVVTQWASRGLVMPNADRTALVTTQGTVVVPGHGYPGSPPTNVGQAVGTYTASYAYATGQVRVWLGDIDTNMREVGSGSVTRTINDLEVRAERPALIAWDPCAHVGAMVSLCDEYCGPGS